MKRQLTLLVWVLMLGGCAARQPDLAATDAAGEPSRPEAGARAAPRPAKTTETPEKRIEIDGEPLQGDARAPLTLVGFIDFQCFYCAHFAAETLPQLEREYIRSGKVKYVFRDLPIENIHPHAFKAAVAAHCAGEQKKFWPMHNLLFVSMQRLEPEDLVRNAHTLGLDESKFRGCLNAADYDKAIGRDVAAATELGVKVTPTFYFGYTPKSGEPMEVKAMVAGSQPYELFKKVIGDLLRQLEKERKVSP